MKVFMNDREFSDVEIFQHSGKGIPLFIIIIIIIIIIGSIVPLGVL